MTLPDEIRSLRDRALNELNTAHDYYVNTQAAWIIVQKYIGQGNTFTIKNRITSTITGQDNLATMARGYVTEQLAEATFQQFVAIFENFFFDLLRLWLVAHPRNLIGKKVDFKAILEAPDIDSITRMVVDKELNEVLYERPAGWFAYLEDKVKLGCPSVDEIERIAEAKASRDALVHNRGVAGKTYESKAGKLARYAEGQTIDIPEAYHRGVWELIRKVVSEVSDAAIAKAT